MNCRFTDLGHVDPERGAAADSAVFGHVSGKLAPCTVMVYSRNRPAVSLGRFRNIEEDVRCGKLKEYGVSAVRRISGGSTVFTGTSQIIYSVVAEDNFGKKSESYERLCGCLISALRRTGVNAFFKEPNDVLSEGKKISGSAQYRRDGFVLHHGTLIMEPEPLAGEILKPVKHGNYDGITSVNECLGHSVSRDVMVKNIRDGFGELFDFDETGLTREETELIDETAGRFRVSVSDP
ncbi:MAG: lipoate--protein ligase family protein [Candidatus Methanomethylophilaceae archaeon]